MGWYFPVLQGTKTQSSLYGLQVFAQALKSRLRRLCLDAPAGAVTPQGGTAPAGASERATAPKGWLLARRKRPAQAVCREILNGLSREVEAIIQIRERKEYILGQLEEKSAVTVTELSEALALSEVSIRKLLMTMEQEGTLRRTWGGAVCTHGSLREFSHQEKLTRHLEEKKAIARAAYDCIADGEAIFLDCGTTTIQLARLIIEGPKRNILVCTNAINIAAELARARDIHSIVIGGELRGNILSCVGGLAEWSLQRLFFDKGFVSGNHFTIEHGFSAPIFPEAELKRRVLSVSKEKFILMDYSKYGDDSLVQIAPAGEIDTLITDWRAPEELVQSFGEKGVKVIRAPKE